MTRENCVYPGCEKTADACQKIKGNIQEIVGFFN